MRKTPILIAVTAITAITAASAAMPVAANAAAATSATSATSTTSATSAASAASALPTFDYRDCPQLPTGVDPAAWRCEVLIADGTVTIGTSTAPFHFTAVTHAEGPMPDGSEGQVFGGFRADRIEVPGRQSGDGHGPKLWMQPRLAAIPDFLSQSGAMSLTFQLTGPRLGDGCSIGTIEQPVQVAAERVPGTAGWISQDPPLIKFAAYDDTFTAPVAEGCGPLTAPLNRRLGLPKPSGNLMTYDATYTFRTYDQLPTS